MGRGLLTGAVPRTHLLTSRFTKEEVDLIRKAAASAGCRSLSEFVRAASLSGAKSIIEQGGHIELTMVLGQ